MVLEVESISKRNHARTREFTRRLFRESTRKAATAALKSKNVAAKLRVCGHFTDVPLPLRESPRIVVGRSGVFEELLPCGGMRVVWDQGGDEGIAPQASAGMRGLVSAMRYFWMRCRGSNMERSV
eukprot:748581-Hanusia_phi.AAC.3